MLVLGFEPTPTHLIRFISKWKLVLPIIELFPISRHFASKCLSKKQIKELYISPEIKEKLWWSLYIADRWGFLILLTFLLLFFFRNGYCTNLWLCQQYMYLQKDICPYQNWGFFVWCSYSNWWSWKATSVSQNEKKKSTLRYTSSPATFQPKSFAPHYNMKDTLSRVNSSNSFAVTLPHL